MDHNSEAAILINDLDSMRHRIEALPAHPHYTEAINLVTQAKQVVRDGMVDMHQRGMQERFAKASRA